MYVCMCITTVICTYCICFEHSNWSLQMESCHVARLRGDEAIFVMFVHSRMFGILCKVECACTSSMIFAAKAIRGKQPTYYKGQLTAIFD